MSKNTHKTLKSAQSRTKTADHCTKSSPACKPLILAVETSGRLGSVAIAEGQQILAEVPFSIPMKHSAEILPAVNDLITRFDRKPKEIEHVYISVGPGSFTGLRIAVTLAKIMGLTNSANIVPVDTLDVIAANATDYINEKNTAVEKIAAILDAKRGQFFIAVYERETGENTIAGTWKKVIADCLMTASQFVGQFAGKDKPIWLLGEGLLFYKDKFQADGIGFLDQQYWTPRAANVHALGWPKAQAGLFTDPLALQPKYMRQPDAKPKI